MSLKTMLSCKEDPDFVKVNQRDEIYREHLALHAEYKRRGMVIRLNYTGVDHNNLDSWYEHMAGANHMMREYLAGNCKERTEVPPGF